jgi:hypothetical protein
MSDQASDYFGDRYEYERFECEISFEKPNTYKLFFVPQKDSRGIIWFLVHHPYDTDYYARALDNINICIQLFSDSAIGIDYFGKLADWQHAGGLELATIYQQRRRHYLDKLTTIEHRTNGLFVYKTDTGRYFLSPRSAREAPCDDFEVSSGKAYTLVFEIAEGSEPVKGYTATMQIVLRRLIDED